MEAWGLPETQSSRSDRTIPLSVQAWGLLELQRGNALPAVLMLERAVKLQPTCSPVLNWQQVSEARKAVGARRRRTGTKMAALPPL